MKNHDFKARKLVSIVIPSFRAQATLENCLESIKGASEVFEIIVCLNGHDRSEAICDEFAKKNPEINLVVLPAPKVELEMADNWTRACEAARGKYLKLLCADDLLIHENLQKQVDCLENDIQLEFVASKRRLINGGGKIILSSFGGNFLRPKNTLGRLMRTLALTGTNPIGEPSAVLFRSTSVIKKLPWSKNMDYVIDLDMYLRILTASPNRKFGFVKENICIFLISDNSQSFKLSRFQNEQFQSLVRSYFLKVDIPCSILYVKIMSFTSPVAAFLRRSVYRVFT